MHIIIWTTLIKSHACMRPLGAYQIASWMREHGYTVKVIDFCSHMSTDDLVAITKKYITKDTFAIGVSTTFWADSKITKHLHERKNFTEPDWVVSARNIIEKEHPNLDWVLGGSASSVPFLSFNWIKFHAEGEDKFLKYADEKTNNNKHREPFDIFTSKKRYHETDFISSTETLALELGRGCQFKCKFCRYPNIGKKPKTYRRSMECVKEELLHNYHMFGTTKYLFVDETVNEDYDKVVELAQLAKELPFELEWVGYIRADLIYVNQETIHLLKDSGMRSCYMGIESLNPETSTLIGKGWMGKHGKEFLVKLRDEWAKHNISFFMSFIVGLPNEDKESLLSTLSWLKTNNFKSWDFYPLNIYRDQTLVWRSEFDRNYELYGYRFTKPFDNAYWENDIWNIETCVNFSNELNKGNREDFRFTCFDLADVSNMGYAMEELVNKPRTKELLLEIAQRKEVFLKNYISKSLTY